MHNYQEVLAAHEAELEATRRESASRIDELVAQKAMAEKAARHYRESAKALAKAATKAKREDVRLRRERCVVDCKERIEGSRRDAARSAKVVQSVVFALQRCEAENAALKACCAALRSVANKDVPLCHHHVDKTSELLAAELAAAREEIFALRLELYDNVPEKEEPSSPQKQVEWLEAPSAPPTPEPTAGALRGGRVRGGYLRTRPWSAVGPSYDLALSENHRQIGATAVILARPTSFDSDPAVTVRQLDITKRTPSPTKYIVAKKDKKKRPESAAFKGPIRVVVPTTTKVVRPASSPCRRRPPIRASRKVLAFYRDNQQ